MRKLTLLAIAAVLMLVQSSPALSSTFSGPYACRASGTPSYSLSAPVMTFSANASSEILSAGTLLFWQSGGLCEYGLSPSLTSEFYTLSGSAGSGILYWVLGNVASGCPSTITDIFGFVLSGLASSNTSANTVQTTSNYAVSYECTQK
jgi:hypothetical protein